MFFGRWTSWQVACSDCILPRFTSHGLLAGLLVTVGLMSGCGESSTPLADTDANYEPAIAWVQDFKKSTTAADLQLASYSHQPHSDQQQESADSETSSHYWSFPSAQSNGGSQDRPTLTSLPTPADPPVVEEANSGLEGPVLENRVFKNIKKQTQKEQLAAEKTPADEKRIAWLLPPQAIPPKSIRVKRFPSPQSTLAFSPTELREIKTELREIRTGEITLMQDSPVPVSGKLSEQQRMLAALLQEDSPASTGVLTDSRINELAKTKIQHAYAMASRGGMYVARQELVEVLRRISQAKDAQRGTPERSVALAAGLRALREAEDFEPRGTQLEAEMDITVLCASHRTPIAKQTEATKLLQRPLLPRPLLPRLAMDRYLRYAQIQLGMSVAGEAAGSMALHALGKLSSQLGRAEPDKHRLADRHAIAYQQAALLAHNQNYLAAHELGVLLASSGHFVESHQLLMQVASRAPNAVVYRNLARVQDRLGQQAQALVSRDYARQLSQQGATGTNNVQWVSPSQFAQAGAQTPQYTTAQQPSF